MAGAGFTDVHLSDHTVVMHFEGGVRQAMQAIATTPFAAGVKALGADDYERMMHTVMHHLGRSADLDETVDIPARTLIGTAARG
jgi:hypothetical protein